MGGTGYLPVRDLAREDEVFGPLRELAMEDDIKWGNDLDNQAVLYAWLGLALADSQCHSTPLPIIGFESAKAALSR